MRLLQSGCSVIIDANDLAAIYRPGIDTEQDVSRTLDIGVRQTNHFLHQLGRLRHAERVEDDQFRGRYRLLYQLLQEHGVEPYEC
jgi:hypothetical protein